MNGNPAMAREALLVMAYGTPQDLDEVEAYYTHIRHGRAPDPEALRELQDRYRVIGGRSPLLDITRAQASGLSERVGVPAYVGQKHAAPFIADAMGKLAEESIDRAIGLVMAPHFSAMSVGEYHKRVSEAAEAVGWTGQFEMIDSWHLLEGWLEVEAGFVRAALSTVDESARAQTIVIFTAHSLPAGIVRSGDPYPVQLEETAAAIAERAALRSWRVAWQSASPTDQPWLGPDVLEVMVEVASQGTKGVVICPCGFVADHLEVLYDVDVECRDLASDLGIAFARTQSPNDDPRFLDALGGLVKAKLAAATRL